MNSDLPATCICLLAPQILTPKPWLPLWPLCSQRMDDAGACFCQSCAAASFLPAMNAEARWMHRPKSLKTHTFTQLCGAHSTKHHRTVSHDTYETGGKRSHGSPTEPDLCNETHLPSTRCRTNRKESDVEQSFMSLMQQADSQLLEKEGFCVRLPWDITNRVTTSQTLLYHPIKHLQARNLNPVHPPNKPETPPEV